MFTSDSTILIPLTQGQSTIVDTIDADWVNQWKWYVKKNEYGKFYAQRMTPHNNGKQDTIRLNRVLLERIVGRLLLSYEECDHINGDSLDNTRSNLRLVTHQQNMWNQRVRSTNSSGATGLCWNKRIRKWQAYITVNGKRIHLGFHLEFQEALEARKQAEVKYFGEFRRKG